MADQQPQKTDQSSSGNINPAQAKPVTQSPDRDDKSEQKGMDRKSDSSEAKEPADEDKKQTRQ